MGWVWLVIAILVKVKRTLRGHILVLGGLHAKYGLPPHRMTSKAINDIKKFSVADRSEWLDIKKNDTNHANKRKAGVEGYKAMKKKLKQRND